jgi:hypothetical protein
MFMPHCALRGPFAAGRQDFAGRATMAPLIQPPQPKELPHAISMSSASLPVFQHMLGNLATCWTRPGPCRRKEVRPRAVLLQYRLAPDMLPFTRQILIACDAAKNGVARISGVEAPKFDDTESTLPELKERIEKDPGLPGHGAGRRWTAPKTRTSPSPWASDATRTMKAEAYLKHWMLPNFYFHVTTAYAILRHNGVELGKSDYLVGSQA